MPKISSRAEHSRGRRRPGPAANFRTSPISSCSSWLKLFKLPSQRNMCGLQHEFLWCEQRKRLQGKKTHVTIPAETPFGKFAIMAFPEPTHPMRGGSSFLAAGGQGFLKVKQLQDNHVFSCQIARATICGCIVQINHDFKGDGYICRIPGS